MGPSPSGKVVVVTGASAGVGRASAHAFARRGAKLALIARDAEALEGVKAEIETNGGQAEIFPLDVADADAVFGAAQAIEDGIGPVDIWVNNAMVTVFSPVSDLTPDEIARVTDVCYLGFVHGTLAALKHMRLRDRGTIVQVGSSLSYRAIPLQSAYCAAKHAVLGFTNSCRTELLHDGSGVQITTVHLPAINTPQFDWARSKRAMLPRPVAPVHAATTAARAIVRAAEHPAREYWLGGSSLFTILGNMVLPQLMDRILANQAVEGQDRDERRRSDRPDNLFSPVRGIHRTDGVFSNEARKHAVLIPAPAARIGAVVLGALAVGLAGALLGRALTPRTAPGKSHRR